MHLVNHAPQAVIVTSLGATQRLSDKLFALYILRLSNMFLYHVDKEMHGKHVNILSIHLIHPITRTINFQATPLLSRTTEGNLRHQTRTTIIVLLGTGVRGGMRVASNQS